MKRLSFSAGYLSAAILVAASQAGWAQETAPPPPSVDVKGAFTQATTACLKVVPEAVITPDHMRMARERWKDRPDILQDEALLQQWALDHFELLGSVLGLPDLTAHPMAGRKIKIQLLSQDYLDQIGKSEAVYCTLPQRGYFNPINNDLGGIRGDIAEALNTLPPADFFATKYPQIKQLYDEVVANNKDKIINPDTVQMLTDIRTEMDAAQDTKAVGVVLDRIWAAMMVLEEDHLTPAAKKLVEAQEQFKEILEEQFSDPDKLENFTKDAFEAMDEFLKEQIEKAEEAGNEELKKQLEEMREQLRKMQEQMQQDGKPPNKDDAWKMQEMMQQMEQMMQNPSMSNEQMMQMMQQMMQQMQDQKTMQELQEMLEKQRELMGDTDMSEEEKQQLLESMKETLDGFSDQMKERAEEAERRLREEIQKRKDQGAEQDEAANEEALKELKELGEDLQRAIENKENETEDPERLETLENLKSRLQETMERLSTDKPKKPEELQRALEVL